ncbi:hypothetical protein K1T71_013843 [Dendrolimus kikuchii]|uniref:Uncharacterized protein n=1 Tax=Dendrolimus kikuchii TaxID=765133 RepID=A0ACC1CG59_9NEOP|nr:hypothetical protein K1T71_013843 [Dendrolimus kikuchii]
MGQKFGYIYKDKRKSLKAWFEICHIMNENFTELPDREKNKYGKLMAQKWKNIRDAWMKCDKKMRETKSGSGAKPVHKYQYYDNLQFLKKITQCPIYLYLDQICRKKKINLIMLSLTKERTKKK